MGFGGGGDCAYSASKGAAFALAMDLGRLGPRFGIRVNAVMPSGTSRMGDLSNASMNITRTYFDASPPPLVVALYSDDYTASGECFRSAVNRSAVNRSAVTLATFLGRAEEITARGVYQEQGQGDGEM